MVTSLNFSWTKVSFNDDENEIVTKLDVKSHNYPLVYVISLLPSGIIQYKLGSSRILYIGRSERKASQGRMHSHLKWMRKAMYLNPELEGFRVAVTCPDDIGIGKSAQIEGSCLTKFEKCLGSLPLFNTNRSRERHGDVELNNDRNIFRKHNSSDGATIVIKTKGIS
jgi:hypothetical protein